MSEPRTTSYDEVPYDVKAFTQTHPDRLATVATLLGLKPPPIDRCRVLELGCARGGNLLPMALGLPQSQFVGIDLSRRQIAEAQAMAERLQLRNVDLRHADLLEVDESFGQFDYIIAHGIYSWVPPHVQDHLLTICSRNLSPDGVAFISYNTYPGWHMRGMIRDMMVYHGRHYSDPRVAIAQARALLDFLAQATRADQTAYSTLLKEELEVVRRKSDPYLIHEYLEDINAPLYFYQFVERAAAKGLQYLGDAQLAAMVPGNFGPEIAETLRRISPDMIHMEQYMDFVRNRMFRQSLLCHQGLKIDYTVQPDRLWGMHVRSLAQPVSPRPDIQSTAPEQFRRPGPDGMTLTSREPIMKAAMLILAEVQPHTVGFEHLAAEALARLGWRLPLESPEGRDAARRLAGRLLNCYMSSNILELHVRPLCPEATVRERPVGWPYARIQAEQSSLVATQRHEMAQLSELERQLLLRLDGQRDHATLVEEMSTLVLQGKLVMERDGVRVTEPERVRILMKEAVDFALRALAAYGVLIA
ncbi:MAG: class I SAM-dependent methyltransferase [Gemmataceae bacterium]|nr:class I SAM-dependent methyltransferase [Gemmataceae bacterium]MDW8267270.1 class I SAM-dependent methyltransferase [Gemmataceae bacterium]